MTEIPEEGSSVKEYGPNLPAAVYTVFGGNYPSGMLPVTIPELDDQFMPSDTVLYPRGFGLTYVQ